MDAHQSSKPCPLLELPVNEAPAQTNQRVYPRLTRPFRVQRRGEAEWRGVNISAGGMLCAAREPVWPGNVVHLELLLGEARLEVEGEVAELVALPGTVGMRVRFDSLDPNQLSLILHWMEQRKH